MAAKKIDVEAESTRTQVLLENTTAGIRSTAVSVPRKSVSPVGTREHQTDQLLLLPGVNFIAADRFARHESELAHWIMDGTIVVHTDWGATPMREVLRAIGNTGDVKVLRRLAQDESREGVIEAIDKQIATVTRGGLTAKRAHAAHAKG